jgi:hypothetical protein
VERGEFFFVILSDSEGSIRELIMALNRCFTLFSMTNLFFSPFSGEAEEGRPAKRRRGESIRELFTNEPTYSSTGAE